MTLKKDYFIGDKSFYKKVMWVVLPIIIQNTITNVVNLLDNVMVGRLGTLEMSAVAIINQIIFVVNLCIFGGISGAGLFGTQYAGAKDNEGLRQCFRIKIIMGAVILLVAGIVLGFFPRQLIGLYLSETTSAADASATIGFGLRYLYIMLIGLVPFAITQVYSSSLREVGETKTPMYASSVAILINLVFNYFLIFGTFGFPKLGVMGAAIATTLSRFVEMAIVILSTRMRTNKFPFVKGIYRNFRISAELFKKVIKKSIPLIFNEGLWALGMATYLQCYSARGLQVVAAANIASTVNGLFNVVLISLGTAVAIMVGQYLGANEIDKAKKTAWRLITLSVGICVALGVVLILLSGIIPNVYNTESIVKEYASEFLIALALMLPFDAFAHGCYFTLRSGGKIMITFWFDCGSVWLIGVPTAFLLVNYTNLPVGLVYLAVRSLDVIKTVVGTILIRKGIWISNIVK